MSRPSVAWQGVFPAVTTQFRTDQSLHLDARPDLVQCIKLCEQIMGRGSALTRAPRLPLPDAERGEVERLMAHALAHRPALPDVGLAPA